MTRKTNQPPIEGAEYKGHTVSGEAFFRLVRDNQVTLVPVGKLDGNGYWVGPTERYMIKDVRPWAEFRAIEAAAWGYFLRGGSRTS